MQNVITLVDYDNVAQLEEKSRSDQFLNLDFIAELCSKACADIVDGSRVTVRLYGGWVQEDGTYTERSNWLFSQLHLFRQRVLGKYLLPQLALGLLDLPHLELRGSLRGQKRRQKMVDTLLCTDLVTLSRNEQYDQVYVFSSDDDMVPGIVQYASITAQRPLTVMCAKSKMAWGCNTSILRSVGVRFFTY